MDRWDAVIFDNDGVLVDSERLANDTLARLLTAHGWPVTPAECVAEFLGGTIDSVRQSVEARSGHRLPADFERRYHKEIFDRFPTELRAVPDVTQVVDLAGDKGCVASSGSMERIRLALQITGLRDRFGDRLFSAESVARGKPAPDLFLHAARELGVVPRRAVVIEDSPFGVAAARAAGMTVFGYAALTPPERLCAADATFTSMAELPGLLGLPTRGGR